MEESLLIKQGTIYNSVDEEPFVGDIFVVDGKIQKIAPMIEGKEINNAEILDATGLMIYPGFVDAHSHLGLQGFAIGFESEDFNELGDYVTPQLSAIDAIYPQDKTFEMARSGGVTCVATGPGSSNVIGGTFCAIKTNGSRVDDMIVKKKVGMKIAFGENPKNCYKQKGIYSRMSIAATIREMLHKAEDYNNRKKAAGADVLKMPAYDEKLEALIPVIEGELPLKAHVHRADDIFTALRIGEEFGIEVKLDHVTDGALIATELGAAGVSAAVGPSFGHATKYELREKSFTTPGVLAKAGCNVAIITDAPVVEQRYLALCAGFAIDAGMSEFEALRAITLNAAKHIGVDDRVGSIEAGKDADFVITRESPFGRGAKVLMTLIDGKIVYRAEEQ